MILIKMVLVVHMNSSGLVMLLLHCQLPLKKSLFTLCILETLANCEDPDKMLHIATFHQGLHCLLITIQGTLVYQIILKNS